MMITDIIFLDTGIFETENFFKGHKLLKLVELSKNKTIKLKITEITYREVLNRLKANLLKAYNSIKKIEKLIDNEAKVLKNVPSYDSYYPVKTFEIDDVNSELIEMFKKFLLEYDIEVIDIKSLDIENVLEKYFTGDKPFGEGRKKHEFPDAINLDIITNWCKKKKELAYVLAIDGDIKEYVCPDEIIYPRSDIADFLEGWLKIENEFVINSIISNIKLHGLDIRKYFEDNLSDSFNEVVHSKILQDGYYDDCDVDIHAVTDFNLLTAHVIALGNKTHGFAICEIGVDIMIELPITYYSIDGAYYDKEDDHWYGRKSIDDIIEVKARLTLETRYDYEFDGNDLINFELADVEGYTTEDIEYESLLNDLL